MFLTKHIFQIGKNIRERTFYSSLVFILNPINVWPTFFSLYLLQLHHLNKYTYSRNVREMAMHESIYYIPCKHACLNHHNLILNKKKERFLNGVPTFCAI